jgi:hypothetical protein
MLSYNKALPEHLPDFYHYPIFCFCGQLLHRDARQGRRNSLHHTRCEQPLRCRRQGDARIGNVVVVRRQQPITVRHGEDCWKVSQDRLRKWRESGEKTK